MSADWLFQFDANWDERRGSMASAIDQLYLGFWLKNGKYSYSVKHGIYISNFITFVEVINVEVIHVSQADDPLFVRIRIFRIKEFSEF